MAKILYGERIGRTGLIRVGCAAVIFDAAHEKILLTRRVDNGQWCLPGGGLDPGESAAEACLREVREETGLEGRITRLIGVYTSPHQLIEYADGNRWQLVALSFEVEIIGGALGLSDETTDARFFAPAELDTIELMPHHHERIADALARQTATYIR